MAFYTSVCRQGSLLLHRGFRDGISFSEKVKYKPYLFLKNNKSNSKYKTLDGTNVEKIQFDDIWEESEWKKRHKDVAGFEIFGTSNKVTSFIYDNYDGQIEFDKSLICVGICDIEIATMIVGDDFIDEAPSAITTISLFVNGTKYAFGTKPFKAPKDVKYFHCTDELTMLRAFIEVWEGAHIDVLTGWNCLGFDVPYLINRIARLMTMDDAARLSPWNKLIAKEVPNKFGRVKKTYDILGISIIDYQELYKKFTIQVHGKLESYSLNFVSYFELDEKKIDYSEFGSLIELYEKDFQKYMEYNIHDCELIARLDNKMKFLELLYEITYIAKCNYQDVLKTLPVWESLIHSYLMDRRTVVPNKKKSSASMTIPGGFVKEPRPDLYRWVLSFDVNSLYPNLIQQYNLSPETLVKKMMIPDIDQLVEDKDFDPQGLSVAANGCAYSKDKLGFLPALMKYIIDSRTVFKDKMLDVQTDYEKTKSAALKSIAESLKAKQQAYKILANSGYGAFANEYFTFFSYELAMSITMSGQLTIKWVAKALNDYMNKIMGTKNVDYIVAIDTDSNYLNCGPLVAKLFGKDTSKEKIVNFLDKFAEEKCQKVIDKCFAKLASKMNAYEPCLIMKREAIAESALWSGKKRYAMTVLDNEGVRYDKPKIKITGMESKRSSVPEICRKALEDSLTIVLTKTEDDLCDYVMKFREKFMASTFYDIANPRGINGVEKYFDPVNRFKSKCPIHVKGAIVYNEFVKDNNLIQSFPLIQDGDNIKFSYLKVPNRLKSEVISCLTEVPSDLKIEKILDYETQYNKTFLDPLKAITKIAKWDIERENNLEDAW